MIDPRRITNFQRTEAELREFAMFCIAVAGKSSEMQAKKLDIFLAPHTHLPFERIKSLEATGNFMDVLMQSKLGQYKRIGKAFLALANSGLDLRTCTVEELEKIPGLGLKTSRFFLCHTRPNQNYGVLDTHLLSHMREDLNIPTPKATPSNPKVYYALEAKLLEVIKASGKTYAEYDLDVWKSRQKNRAPLEQLSVAHSG